MASNCTRMIPSADLIFGGNVRTDECMALPAMVESFRRHGFKSNHPLVVSEKQTEEGVKYLVLCGNRRGLALQWLAENETETLTRTLNGGKVPAVVHKGLTAEEEVDLRIDHSSDEDRVPLDEWSLYVAIRQLVQAGFDTQERIAHKLGLFKTTGKKAGEPRREFVQVRVNLARLPEFVQAEFRKLTLDKDSTFVRWSDVARLYKVYHEEYTTGGMDGKGAGFQAVWQEIMTPPKVIDTPTDASAGPKELSPAEAVKRSQSASSAGLKEALLALTRQSKADLSEIDAQIVRGESALQILADVKDWLGEKDYAELVDSATSQGDTRRAEAEAEAEVEADVAEADAAEADAAPSVETVPAVS